MDGVGRQRAPAADRDGVPDPGGVEVPSAARAAEDGVKDDVRRRPELVFDAPAWKTQKLHRTSKNP